MKRNLISPLIIALFFTVSCVPSRTVINTNEQQSIDSLNNRLEGRKIEVKFTDNRQIKVKEVYLTTDSLFFRHSNNNESVSLSQVRSITSSPKSSISSLIALPLFVIGAYGIVTFDDRGGLKEVGKLFGGVVAVVLSGVIIGIGNSIESEIYYFNKKN